MPYKEGGGRLSPNSHHTRNAAILTHYHYRTPPSPPKKRTGKKTRLTPQGLIPTQALMPVYAACIAKKDGEDGYGSGERK